jgi:hypothetical protein
VNSINGKRGINLSRELNIYFYFSFCSAVSTSLRWGSCSCVHTVNFWNREHARICVVEQWQLLIHSEVAQKRVWIEHPGDKTFVCRSLLNTYLSLPSVFMDYFFDWSPSKVLKFGRRITLFFPWSKVQLRVDDGLFQKGLIIRKTQHTPEGKQKPLQLFDIRARARGRRTRNTRQNLQPLFTKHKQFFLAAFGVCEAKWGAKVKRQGPWN